MSVSMMKASDQKRSKNTVSTKQGKPAPTQYRPILPSKGLGPCGCGCGGASATCRSAGPSSTLEAEKRNRQLSESRRNQTFLDLQRILGNRMVNRLMHNQKTNTGINAGPHCGLHEEEERAGRPNERQRPHAGDATIECDGSGGYRVDLGGWAGAPCGIEGCVTRHEQSHISDWQGRWPNGCKNNDGTPKPAGYLPLGGPGYADFLRRSECSAYTVEESCIAPLLASAKGNCRERLRAHLADTRSQKSHFCS